ncbi:LPS export ABC transporter periplasmic protein LptC [Marinobacterium sp. D7]|uniref:LPS export ABC transporter periplasmic protein LptC n=1 Tax=Marinobacterium ramblicola TaxID=2849041 RepID=UPI001C2CEF94|nr:LPS export ABC transporter periplasmic protein LptC [Marinobacterium ramblicola]
MFGSARIRLLIALAIITPVLVYWGFSGETVPQQPGGSRADRGSIDFFMRDAETVYWSTDGARAREWRTPELNHYPQRERSELRQPETTMPTADGGIYKMRANEGWIVDDQSQIQLAGSVEVHHNPQSGPAGILTTSSLSIFPPQNLARTDAPATLVRDGERTDTVGLEVYFDQRRIELLSNVQGRYNAR